MCTFYFLFIDIFSLHCPLCLNGESMIKAEMERFDNLGQAFLTKWQAYSRTILVTWLKSKAVCTEFNSCPSNRLTFEFFTFNLGLDLQSNYLILLRSFFCHSKHFVEKEKDANYLVQGLLTMVDRVEKTRLNPFFSCKDSSWIWPCVIMKGHNVSPIDECRAFSLRM